MKISHEYHPSAPPHMRYSAIDDDTYDGIPWERPNGTLICSPMGWGATEDEAKQDLLDLIHDREIERQIADEERPPKVKDYSASVYSYRERRS